MLWRNAQRLFEMLGKSVSAIALSLFCFSIFVPTLVGVVSFCRLESHF
jgi:hypothetical protein